MGKPHTPWDELEGQRLRIDVGSTKEEALASQSNSTIFFTKDRSIVMNGCVFSDAQTQQPVRVNVCRAIPTRPRKGQIYFFENRVTYRIKRSLMKAGEVFSPRYGMQVIGFDGTGNEAHKKFIEEAITKDIWPDAKFVRLLVLEARHNVFVTVEKDGFVGDEGVLKFWNVEHFLSRNIVPSSPNFALIRPSGYVPHQNLAKLRVKCVAEPPVSKQINDENLYKFAHFLLRAKKYRCLTDCNTSGFGLMQYPMTDENAGIVRCRSDVWEKKKFYIIAKKRRGKASEKKVFVKKCDYSTFDVGLVYAVQPLRQR